MANATSSTCSLEEEASPSDERPNFDFHYVPEITATTPGVIAISQHAVGRALLAQEGIRGIMAVFVGEQGSDERLSTLTRGDLYSAVVALAEFSHAELTRAVRASEESQPRH